MARQNKRATAPSVCPSVELREYNSNVNSRRKQEGVRGNSILEVNTAVRQDSPRPRIGNLETHSGSQVNLNQNHTTPRPIVRVGKKSGEEMCVDGCPENRMGRVQEVVS